MIIVVVIILKRKKKQHLEHVHKCEKSIKIRYETK
jgi:hypothetical protein